MNITTNEKYHQDLLRRARRLRTIGMVSILLSFVFVFILGSNLLFVLLSYPFLLVGFPLWIYARGQQRLLAATPRVDQLLNAELKGMSNKYSLHHYPEVNGKVIQHVLVGPSGLIVFHTSRAMGPIKCRGSERGDRWTARTSLIDRMSGIRPAIGNPSAELREAVTAAEELLRSEGKGSVPVRGLIVFVRNPELEIEGCAYPGVPLSETKQAVRSMLADLEGERRASSVEAILTSEDRRRLVAKLSPTAPAQPSKQATPQRRQA